MKDSVLYKIDCYPERCIYKEFIPVSNTIYKFMLEIDKNGTLRFKIIRKQKNKVDEVAIIRKPQIKWMVDIERAVRNNIKRELGYGKTNITMKGVEINPKVLTLINSNSKIYKTVRKLIKKSAK